MRYIHYEDGVATYPYTLNQLRRDNPDTSFPAAPPAAMLAEYSVYPVAATSPPDGDVVTEGQPQLVDGVWTQRWEVSELPLNDHKERLKQDNASQRVRTLQAGIAYDFPDGTGTVQTRNPTDFANMQRVASMATALANQGVTDPVLFFRDAENVTHSMTPAQAQSFGLAVGQATAAIYEKKWTVDAAIDALTTVEQCKSFDIDAAWR